MALALQYIVFYKLALCCEFYCRLIFLFSFFFVFFCMDQRKMCTNERWLHSITKTTWHFRKLHFEQWLLNCDITNLQKSRQLKVSGYGLCALLTLGLGILIFLFFISLFIQHLDLLIKTDMEIFVPYDF